MMKIGILALQGGFEAHARMLTALNVDWIYVRQPNELKQIDGLILPGGESPVMLKLMHENNLYSAVENLQKRSIPIFGTCAGAILLAKYVTPWQASLGFIDATIERNAYGRQLASHIAYGDCVLKTEPLEMVFIRAPQIHSIASSAQIIAAYQGKPVCVRQNHYVMATFHPELTCDFTLHQYFVEMVTTCL